MLFSAFDLNERLTCPWTFLDVDCTLPHCCEVLQPLVPPQRSAFLWSSGCCTSTISVSIIPLELCRLPSSICPVPVHPRVSSFHLHNKKLLNLSALQNKLTSIDLKFYMKFYLFMLQFLLLLVKFWEFLAMCFHLDSSSLLLPYLPHLFMSQICFLFSKFNSSLTPVCASHLLLVVGSSTGVWSVYQEPHPQKNWFFFPTIMGLMLEH